MYVLISKVKYRPTPIYSMHNVCVLGNTTTKFEISC